MLGMDHMMMGAAGIFHATWGKNWPRHILCFPFPNDARADSLKDALQLMGSLGIPKPPIAASFLYTDQHFMAVMDVDSVAVALDGTGVQNANNLKTLAMGAMTKFTHLGYQRKKLDYPEYWNQKEGWECGWHVLHFLRAVCRDGVCRDATLTGYTEPAGEIGDVWKEFQADMNSYIADVLACHGVAPSAESQDSVPPTSPPIPNVRQMIAEVVLNDVKCPSLSYGGFAKYPNVSQHFKKPLNKCLF